MKVIWQSVGKSNGKMFVQLRYRCGLVRWIFTGQATVEHTYEQESPDRWIDENSHLIEVGSREWREIRKAIEDSRIPMLSEIVKTA